ncbi:exported hypothetical protein [Syntrophobacter sp. SbD1]|nr:exported hypothetical protein [Syntrophobacter sp. SbD1]
MGPLAWLGAAFGGAFTAGTAAGFEEPLPG